MNMRQAINEAIGTVRAMQKITDTESPEKLQARIDSLREQLADIKTEADAIEKLHYQLNHEVQQLFND